MSENKVILVKGDSSKWYEQAFFVLRTTTPKNAIPTDFAFEAEKIINAYMDNSISNQNTQQINNNKTEIVEKTKNKSKNKDKFNFYLNVIMLVSCISLLITMTIYFY